MTESIPNFVMTYNFSVEDYHKMADFGILKHTDSVELINGQIIEVTRDKLPKHAATICRLSDIFRELSKERISISDQKAITLGTHSEPEPDLAVVKYREDYYEDGHPTPKDIYLVVEVSLSTQKYDRAVKLPLYASFDIPETWIIDLKKRIIEVYEQPKGDQYLSKKVFGMKDVLSSSFIDKLAVNRVIKVK